MGPGEGNSESEARMTVEKFGNEGMEKTARIVARKDYG